MYLSIKDIRNDLEAHTLIGHDQRSLPLLLYGYGMKFPAFLTHRSGVDVNMIDLIRPLIESGFRINSVHKLLKESCFKNCTRLMIER